MIFKSISAYGLLDFCKEVQESFDEGYTFDFDTNLHVPTMSGFMYYCVMQKSEPTELEPLNLDQEELEQETLKNKVGRPKKTSS